MDNYYGNNGANLNHDLKNDLSTGQPNNKLHFNGKCNKSVEENLE